MKYEITEEFVAEFNRIRAKVDGMNGFGVSNSLHSITIGDTTVGVDVSPQQGELLLAAIIGAESGGGYYQASILYGNSNGGNGGNNANAPAKYTFQLQSQVNQSAVDGPKPKTNKYGALINNALVVNLAEPFVGFTATSGAANPGSHLLWGNCRRRNVLRLRPRDGHHQGGESANDHLHQ